MDLYLSGEISASCFCDAFHLCYDIKLDLNSLTPEEEKIFNKYSSIFCRFSPFEEDLLLDPHAFINEIQLKQAVQNAKMALENLSS
ncbi:MAG: hypothetical protein J6Y35_01425 [Bacteroidales bacterium]|nr:hypothetical protein [Bacteroidales bacterium]